MRNEQKSVKKNSDDRELLQQKVIELQTRINELDKKEKELKKSLQEYDQLFENVRDGIAILSLSGKIVRVNKRIIDVCGYTKDEIVGKRIIQQKMFPFKDRMKMLGHHTKELAGIRMPPLDVEVKTKTGQKVYVEVFGTIIMINGKKRMIVAILRDITERKNAELSFQSIFSSTNEGIAIHEVIYDKQRKLKDYRILNVNPAFESILNIKKEDAIGKKATELYGTNKAPYLDIYADVALTGKPVYFETTFNPLGKSFKISVFSPKKGQFVTLFHDITRKRHLAEEELKKKKLETFGILSAGITHDFNNLLTIIQGNIELAAKNLDQRKKASQLLTKAQEQCFRAANLTDSLQIFADQKSKTIDKFTFIKIINTSAEKFLEKSGISWSLNISEEIRPLKGSLKQISFVVDNLIQNAGESVSEGGKVEIELKNIILKSDQISTLDAGKYLVFIIRDDGTGIPEEFVSKIFDPYFSTKDMATMKGLGLSLSTCYAIVLNHNGYIDVKSKEGKGTTFTVYLPGV